MEMEKMPTLSVMSRKRYYQIEEAARELFKEDSIVQSIMENVRTYMSFDPVVGMYTKEQVQKLYEYQKRRSEELNISIYNYCGRKKYYETHKEQCNKQRTENARRTAALKKIECLEV